MIAYFTASIVGKKYHLTNYQRIINYLKSKNIEVISDHIINTNEDEIRFESKEKRIAFHDKLEKWIRSSDFVIAEVSFPSISVGYEISLALHMGKAVLMLYANGDPPSLLAHHEDDKLVCEQYSPTTVKGVIDDFINYIKGASDTRFTFFITSEIASYLDRVAKKQKLPKSVYLRNLIEKDMKNHR